MENFKSIDTLLKIGIKVNSEEGSSYTAPESEKDLLSFEEKRGFKIPKNVRYLMKNYGVVSWACEPMHQTLKQLDRDYDYFIEVLEECKPEFAIDDKIVPFPFANLTDHGTLFIDTTTDDIYIFLDESFSGYKGGEDEITMKYSDYLSAVFNSTEDFDFIGLVKSQVVEMMDVFDSMGKYRKISIKLCDIKSDNKSLNITFTNGDEKDSKYVILKKAIKFDDSDIDAGTDGEYVEINKQDVSAYKSVESAVLYEGSLLIKLNDNFRSLCNPKGKYQSTLEFVEVDLSDVDITVELTDILGEILGERFITENRAD